MNQFAETHVSNTKKIRKKYYKKKKIQNIKIGKKKI
jgi:hypothetical protein